MNFSTKIVRKFLAEKIPTNPEFWFCYLVSSFGQIGEPFEADFLNKTFNINEKSALAWWDSLTGYSEEFEESEENVENPNSIPIEFQNHVNLIIEFHPGNTYYFLENHLSKEEAAIGDIGGHWALPMLRWDEVVLLSKNVKPVTEIENYSSFVMLLLLPCVWLTKDEDFKKVRRVLTENWTHTGLVSQENAELLTQKFREASNAEEGEFYWFINGENNWVTNAHWSSRSFDKPGQQIALINSLVSSATNNQSN